MEPGRMHRRTSSLTSLGVAFLVVVSGCGGSSETTQTGAGGAGNGTAGGGPGGSQAPGGSGAPAGAGGSSGSAGSVGSGGSAGSLGAAGSGPGGSSAGRGGSATGGTPGSGGAISTGGADAYPVPAQPPADEDGSELWLRYKKVALPSRLAEYQAGLTHVVKAGSAETLQAAQAELVKGLGGLLGATITVADAPTGDGAVVLGTPASSTLVSGLSLGSRLTAVGSEGYLVEAATVAGKKAIVVAAQQRRRRRCTARSRCCASCRRTGRWRGCRSRARPRSSSACSITGTTSIGTVERGYAGRSLWDWDSLPGDVSPRYRDYARANASIGINGTVAHERQRERAGPHARVPGEGRGARGRVPPVRHQAVYLTARFSAPIEIGGLEDGRSARPAPCAQWWKDEGRRDLHERSPTSAASS